jgi:hypothetical protein
MVNKLSLKAELVELGFSFIDENNAIGRIPQNGDIDGIWINIEINIHNYPSNSPNIKMTGYKERNDLYRCIPKTWRHLDEFIVGNDITQSEFRICSLHNWTANPSYTGKFIYDRLLDWLQSNIANKWNEDDDITGWRIIWQPTNCLLYVDEKLMKEVRERKTLTLFKQKIEHRPYKLSGRGSTNSNKLGNEYRFETIDFTGENDDYLFYQSTAQNDPISYIKSFKLPKKTMFSDLHLIRLPGHFQFKTLYQLVKSISLNIDLKAKYKGNLNFPLVVMYKGDKGKIETIAFIANRGIIDESIRLQIKRIGLEVLPERPLGIDLTVGILGLGSLGSQICKMLVQKNTKSIVIADFDKLTVSNLGNHELGAPFLGDFKTRGLKFFFSNLFLTNNIEVAENDNEAIQKSDVLIITVGNSGSFDRLFHYLRTINFNKPIIWSWTSQNNILQEIVITSPLSGCLNCYYHKTKTEVSLKSIQEIAKNEINKFPSDEVDFCGNPHTISIWERLSFLSSQIVSLLSYYNKNGRFPFDYINYLWGMNEVVPTPHIGFLEKHSDCECGGIDQ